MFEKLKTCSEYSREFPDRANLRKTFKCRFGNKKTTTETKQTKNKKQKQNDNYNKCVFFSHKLKTVKAVCTQVFHASNTK